MPKGYVIMTETIRDEDAMRAYGKASFPTMVAHSGTVLVGSDGAEILEGAWTGTRTVVIEFASVDAARAWYASPEYQAARAIRQAAADANVVIVDGFVMPPT